MRKKVSVSLMIMAGLLLISVMLSGCGSSKTTDDSKDHKALIVGKWNNEKSNVVTVFGKDGTFVTYQNGEKILDATYTIEENGANSVNIKTSQGSSMNNVVFKDDNTIEYEGDTLVRVTQDENTSESSNASKPDKADSDTKSPKTLIIGRWTSGGDALQFNKNGEVDIYSDGSQEQSTYQVAEITGSDNSIKITITDSGGSSSSETAVFQDENTMVIGETTFNRNK